MSDRWNPGNVFMRHVDKNGGAYVERHACWSMALFIDEATAAAVKAGGRVEVVDEKAYRDSRWPKH